MKRCPGIPAGRQELTPVLKPHQVAMTIQTGGKGIGPVLDLLHLFQNRRQQQSYPPTSKSETQSDIIIAKQEKLEKLRIQHHSTSTDTDDKTTYRHRSRPEKSQQKQQTSRHHNVRPDSSFRHRSRYSSPRRTTLPRPRQEHSSSRGSSSRGSRSRQYEPKYQARSRTPYDMKSYYADPVRERERLKEKYGLRSRSRSRDRSRRRNTTPERRRRISRDRSSSYSRSRSRSRKIVNVHVHHYDYEFPRPQSRQPPLPFRVDPNIHPPRPQYPQFQYPRTRYPYTAVRHLPYRYPPPRYPPRPPRPPF
ncbi:hypothetical protein DMENIID0001_022330 [Sergentomyia squamirostris]